MELLGFMISNPLAILVFESKARQNRQRVGEGTARCRRRGAEFTAGWSVSQSVGGWLRGRRFTLLKFIKRK